jgi:hypothetical protein
MAKVPRATSRQKSEEEVLDQATSRLIRAVKDKAGRDGKPITRDELRREGYSERFIDKVEQA